MTAALYEAFQNLGYSLAGELGDLDRRARLYHHLYVDSGKRNVFPLIAAHGALWGSGYFKKGLLGATILSAVYLFRPALRRARLRSVAQFADRFRDINRRVCAESYAIYYYTKHYGGDAFIRAVIGDAFADILCECHASNRTDTPFGPARRELLFKAFLNWEQNHIVAPRVAEAFADCEWDAIKTLAQRPVVAFNYLGRNHHLRFRRFADQAERMAGGVAAYRRAEEVGLQYAEQCLFEYDALKESAEPANHATLASKPRPCRVHALIGAK